MTTIAAATLVELEKFGKLASPEGQTALALAARLDANDDPGSAMAAMAKEHRAIMGEITRSATAKDDPIDELRRRRERRLSG